MPETRRCPQCGQEMPPDAPAGLCPKCLLALGFQSQTGGGAVGASASEPGKSAPPAGAPNPAPTTPYPRSGFTPPSPEELTPHFPQLEILELLGQGGMGAVYKARQPALDRLVALKILPPEVGQDPTFGERFTREARALARLSHQNIVTVHDFGQAGGLYYFLMEYIDGANLRQMLAAGKLAPQQALAIVPQICEALQYAHDEGVVHRDIKPENILLDRKGRVKIADFGLAKVLGRPAASGLLTGSRQVMGTPYYMAPEQMERPQDVDHRADIYSLGVVFYEMLTGELPLGRFAPPSRKVEVDARLDEVVLRALESEPERRYQHASEVKTDVENISESPRGGDDHAESRSALAAMTQRVMAKPLVGVGLLLGAIFAGIAAQQGHIAQVSTLMWVVVTLVCVLGLAVTVSFHRRELRGQQAAFALLGGGMGLLAYLFVAPQPLLAWLYKITGGMPGEHGVIVARFLIAIGTVSLAAQLVRVGRQLRKTSADERTTTRRTTPAPPVPHPVRRAPDLGPEQRPQQDREAKSDVEFIPQSQTPPPAPQDSAVALAQSDIDEAMDQVRGPAIGLLVVGVLHCMSLIGAMLLGLWYFLAAW